MTQKRAGTASPDVPFDFEKYDKMNKSKKRREINYFLDKTVEDPYSVKLLADEMKRQGIDTESCNY